MLAGAPRNTIADVFEAESFIHRNSTIKMVIKIWKTVKILMGYTGILECTPLWNIKNLQELLPIEKVKEWETG